MSIEGEVFSKTERKVLRLTIYGLSSPQIGGLLYVSDKTVKFHLGNIYKKLAFKIVRYSGSYSARRLLFQKLPIIKYVKYCMDKDLELIDLIDPLYKCKRCEHLYSFDLLHRANSGEDSICYKCFDAYIKGGKK